MKNPFKNTLRFILRTTADTYETILNRNHKQNLAPALSGWSIVVITDGKNNSLLSHLMDSVYNELNGTPYEIIVVGPPHTELPLNNKNIPLVYIPYKELSIPKVTGWITKKKNAGINKAKYDKVVVSHDYIAFKPGWKRSFDEFGDFDVCTSIIVDKDGERSTDWITWEYPGIGQALVPYDKTTEYQYLCGIYFVGKRDFLYKHPQLEQFRWGEAEDIEWSKEIRKETKLRINTGSTIYFLKTKWKISPEVLEQSKKLKLLLEK